MEHQKSITGKAALQYLPTQAKQCIDKGNIDTLSILRVYVFLLIYLLYKFFWNTKHIDKIIGIFAFEVKKNDYIDCPIHKNNVLFKPCPPQRM